ncbi:hypothetical protein BG005_000712 [Podila minutissima]|nr:hypothetical protein BG005_000712 [Podila minutissima]
MPPQTTFPSNGNGTRETQIITIIVNGTSTGVPAYQTANVTLFPHYNTTTTKAPATRVVGPDPPPPYDPNQPSSSSTDQDKSVTLRNWGLIVMGLVILAIVGGVALRRYRSGRTKKQEPGNFMTVGEDDIDLGGSMGGSGIGGSGIPGASSVSLATLGGVGSGAHGATVDSTIRERRNSVGLQPIPRAMDRKSRP